MQRMRSSDAERRATFCLFSLFCLARSFEDVPRLRSKPRHVVAENVMDGECVREFKPYTTHEPIAFDDQRGYTETRCSDPGFNRTHTKLD
jgi:hypothetical protein